ncbi:MAG: right-handed parallel beta-helix repeat-containing protein [Ignavibacteriaceae bacterium]|nr:right-handed parallel beta-helix repeat-containing protein [Ignavibacteriaceae bacterium]
MRPGFFFRVMLFLCIISLAEAAIIRVPQDYPKIQLAINAAQPGDTVLVADGTYYENLKITKRILLASQFIIDRNESHITNTIINGSQRTHTDSGSAVTFDGNLDTLSGICGFTVTGGTGNIRFYPDGNFFAISGGGIDLYQVSGLRVSHNIIKNNSSNSRDTINHNWGGGFSTGGSFKQPFFEHFIIFEYNRVYNNTSSLGSGEGGGVDFWSNGRIVGNIISGNAAKNKGAGIHIGDKANVLIAENYISNNTAPEGYGGGISVYRSQERDPEVIITNNIFSGNNAVASHLYVQAGKVTVVNNTFVNGGNHKALIIPSINFAFVYLMNNILWNPLIVNDIQAPANTVFAVNCLIRGGYSGGTNIVNSDPLFITGDTLFRLTSASPAIGAGVLSAALSSYILHAPGNDYLGLPRPNPAYSNPDIGAIEHPLGAPSLATTIRVPQDYGTIQAAINAAAEGNIILVSDGIYYENLRINKKITLASEYLIDGDTSHISGTIISGAGPGNSDSGSVINIGLGSDTNTVVTGLTITNGTGTKYLAQDGYYYIGGGGINILAGGASIRYNRIINNQVSGTVALPVTAGAGINIDNANGEITGYEISDNLIKENDANGTGANGGGIYLTGSGKIVRNQFVNNSSRWLVITGASVPLGSYSGAIGIYSNLSSTAKVLIDGNFFTGNRSSYGSVLRSFGAENLPPERVPQLTIQNNIMVKNIAFPPNYAATNKDTGLIHLRGTYSYFINNTMADNLGNYAIYIGTLPQKVSLMNNIIWNPTAGSTQIKFRLETSPAVLSADFNCIQWGYEGFGNISTDPQFVPDDPYYRLNSSSPALGAGSQQWTVGDQLLTAPERDIFGNVRPWPTNYANPDLGAAENSLTDLIEDGTIPTEFTLMQNYPNPFNPSTTIRYTIPALDGEGLMTRVTLKIYDILGREVAAPVDADHEPGTYEIKFNAGALAGGIYIYQIRSGGGLVITKKMMFVK